MSQRKQRRRRRHRRPYQNQNGAEVGPAAGIQTLATADDPRNGADATGRPAVLRMFCCDGTQVDETTVIRPEQLTVAREKWPVVWIDIEGLDDEATNRLIGDVFEIEELALEDAVTPDERPKVEVFGHQVLVAARTVRFDGDAIVTDPVCIFLGDRYLITFRERLARDPFELVRDRIRHGRTRIGHEGCDALCAFLLDVLIDGYFPVLERFGDRLESLEEEALDRPSRDSLVGIHDVRNDLMTLRRALWPTRDLLHALGREPTPLVGDHARAHFRDSYDHTMELLDLMESYREIGSDLRDIYLASLNNRMNDVMKLLTVIATIFMPLTFITGYYGMNFDTKSPWNMPLLSYRYGAIVAAGIMLMTVSGMVMFFWRKGWLKRWH
jgi:magnesium transporter